MSNREFHKEFFKDQTYNKSKIGLIELNLKTKRNLNLFNRLFYRIFNKQKVDY